MVRYKKNRRRQAEIPFVCLGEVQQAMDTIVGIVRVLSPTADAGQPAPGRWLPEQQLTFPITDEPITLGRDLQNAIVLFDPAAAPEHALLRHNRGAWTLENLSETGELTVEGMTVPPGMMASIAPGQCFCIGAAEMQLVAPDLPLSLMVLAEEGPYTSHAASASLLREPQVIWHPRSLVGQIGAALLALVFCVAAVLVAVGLGTLITRRVLSGDGASVLAAFTLPLIPAAGVILLITLIDRYEREPWYLLTCAFLWGAIIAIPPAFIIEINVNHAISALTLNTLGQNMADILRSALFGLNAGITEEAVKGAGLLVLLMIVRDRFENITDGILYGAIIGAGFAMTENIAYFASAESSRQALVFLITGRVILGWLGHSTFTACFGAGLGFMRERRAAFRPWLPPLLGFVAAVALHSLFDFVNFQANVAVQESPGAPLVNILALVAIIGNYVPLVLADIILWTMLMRSLAREAGVLRAYLVDEVRQGVVTPEEYLVLQRASAKQRLQRAFLLARGARLWWGTRALFVAEVGLAFAKWHASITPTPGTPPFAPPSAFRARIRRLRRLLRDAARPDASSTPPVPGRDSSWQRGAR
jgi:RsiW-degrading membrane proteinase PrsW (M82 family)